MKFKLQYASVNKDFEIEISTLEDILTLIKKEGHPVIMDVTGSFNVSYDDKTPVILVYDNYIE